MPLLFLWWAMQVLYSSIPQALLWGVFVVVAVLLVAKNFPASSPSLPTVTPQRSPGRVTEWSRWLHDARRDDHSRWRLAQKLSLLAVKTLAFREQCSPQEIIQRLNDRSLDIPPQCAPTYAPATRHIAPRPKLRRRFGGERRTTQADPLETDPQLVLEYLEETVQHTLEQRDDGDERGCSRRRQAGNQQVERAIVGKRPLLEKILAAILAGGHVLLEDYPGLAKTLIGQELRRGAGSRVQAHPVHARPAARRYHRRVDL